MKKTKLCLNVMLGNEEHVVERMLNSCYKHIDYWVIQCNGSDRTQQIVEDFFKEKNIPGFTYTVEWHYPGWNSDHLIQKCQEANHNCDWFFRIDADEQLEVDDDFDWTLLDDTSIDCWDVTAKSSSSIWYRSRLWNTRFPWRFYHDKRHECIYIEGGERTHHHRLPDGFRHFIINDGQTWVNPTKFLTDALELEEQHIREGTLLTDLYHFWYVAKSYHDACYSNAFPLGEKHQREYARRAIFYYQEYMNVSCNYDEVGHIGQISEMGYYTLYAIGEMYRFLGNYEKAIEYCIRAEPFCPIRNEHIVGLAECYRELGDFEMMKMQTNILVDSNRKLPFPDYHFILNSNFYIDSGEYGKLLHQIACENSGG